MDDINRKTKNVYAALEQQAVARTAQSARQPGVMRGAETMRLSRTTSANTLTDGSSTAPSHTDIFTGELQPHFGMYVAPTHDPLQVALQRGSLHPAAIGVGGTTGAGHCPRSGAGPGGGFANEFHTTYAEGSGPELAEWELLTDRVSGYESMTRAGATWKEQLQPTRCVSIESVNARI